MELIMEKSGDSFVFMYAPTFVNVRNACFIRQALLSKEFRLEALTSNEMVIFVENEDIHISGERHSLFAFMGMARISEVHFASMSHLISGKEGFAVRKIHEEVVPPRNRRFVLRKLASHLKGGNNEQRNLQSSSN